MTYLFNLWNFFQSSSHVCEFDVTRANMPRMRNGTSEWIGECLSTFGIEVTVASWEVKPFRSHYYSNYPDSKDWRDRWPDGWNIRVVTKDEMPPVVNKLSDLPQHASTSDPTWDNHEFVDPRHNSTALLISNYNGGRGEVEQLGQQKIAKGKSEDERINESQIALRSFAENSHQLRIFFEEIVLPDTVPLLENLVGICRQHHSTTNWREPGQ